MVDKNCISYWFPILDATSGVNVPETIIIRMPISIYRGEGDLPSLSYLDTLTEMIFAATRLVGLPAFLRTGQGSGKHDWTSTCFLKESILDSEILDRVARLCEWSQIVDAMGLPYHVWAIRQFLRLKHDFTAFNGMPVAREYRCFIENDEVKCVHPYWPEDAIQSASVEDWRERLRDMYGEGPDQAMVDMAAKVADAFKNDGAWSVDLCEDVDGKWWVTDMAEAKRSFHWKGCANAAAFK